MKSGCTLLFGTALLAAAGAAAAAAGKPPIDPVPAASVPAAGGEGEVDLSECLANPCAATELCEDLEPSAEGAPAASESSN